MAALVEPTLRNHRGPIPPSVVALWHRFLAGKPLRTEEERLLRRAGPFPHKNAWCYGPGVTATTAGKMPCYVCGSCLKPGVDPANVRLLLFSAPEVRPEGTYRLCRTCWSDVRDFGKVQALHDKRYMARELNARWAKLTYYHPSIKRERL